MKYLVFVFGLLGCLAAEGQTVTSTNSRGYEYAIDDPYLDSLTAFLSDTFNVPSSKVRIIGYRHNRRFNEIAFLIDSTGYYRKGYYQCDPAPLDTLFLAANVIQPEFNSSEVIRYEFPSNITPDGCIIDEGYKDALRRFIATNRDTVRDSIYLESLHHFPDHNEYWFKIGVSGADNHYDIRSACDSFEVRDIVDTKIDGF